MGAGLSLVLGAGSSLLKPLYWVHPALDNRIWAIVAFLVLIATQRLPRFPYAFVFFVLGLVFALVTVVVDEGSLPQFYIWRPHFHMPQWVDSHGSDALGMAIGQLPLTTLNSIIAVCQLSHDLLPEVPSPSVTAVGLSVSLMNLTGTWFGGMPMCHGSGGLAAQYRFGARSGASVIVLGLFKIVLGLLFGRTLVDLLKHYPKSLLGIMVVAAGLELAKVGSSLNDGAPDLQQAASSQDRGDSALGSSLRKGELTEEDRAERWTVMLTTAGGILAFRNDAVGFLAGMLCHWAFRLSKKVEQGRGQRSGPSRTERDPLLR